MPNDAPAELRFSRESRIRIDRDGRFWHEGARVEHERLARALASWIAVDEATGRYVLRNDRDWCFVTVDDAPLVVTSFAAAPAGTELTLTDGTRERLAPATLRVDEDDVPYCDVRGGRLPARFSRQAAFDLLADARPRGDGIAVTLGGEELVLPRVPRGQGRPRPPR